MSNGLSASGVRVAFGRRVVLDGVSLSVDAGRSMAVVGPSGIGKTTLLWCLAGLKTPAAGEIRFGGETIYPASSRTRRAFRRRHVGMVLQGGELVPELTALENVVLGGLLAGMRAGDAQARGQETMSRLGLSVPVQGQVATTLSGGERQRVAIARAVVHQPGLVLADEPTAALDAASARSTAELLAKLPEVTGCALVVVTHDERTATLMDDVVALGAPRTEL